MQPSMAQPPIEDYAIIGDGRTAALCSKQGSIDWLCLPRFDSKPIFSRLVAGSRGGCFSISVDGVMDASRRYLDGTAILETTWRTADGTATLTEGMVVDVSSTLLPQVLLVRRLQSFGARVSATVLYSPMQGMPGVEARTQRRGDTIVGVWGPLAVGLASAPRVPLAPGREHRIELEPGAHVTFALTAADRQPLVLIDPDEAFDRLRDSERWWRRWSDEIHHEGPHREAVLRSLITLRLLTYTPSGAPVAAPTTSLPEVIGGGRNWDYRYAWPRDACIGIAAFLGVVIGAVLLRNPIFMLLIGGAGATIPIMWMKVQMKRRAAKLHSQLADILMILASSLRAGHGFFQALDLVAKEIGDPGSAEFGRVVAEVRLGRPVDEALNAMAERIGSDDFKWAVLGVNVQREVGGNLAEILDTIGETVRERDAIRRQIKVLSAEGRLSIGIMASLPPLVALYIAKVNPGYLNLLFSTRVGLLMVGVAGCLMAVGIFWMRKIVNIDV